MNPQLKSVADIYAFNTMALRPALSDLSNEEAGRRCRNGQGNSITFLVGHLLASRLGLLKRLNATTENPFSDLFGGNAAAQDAAAYPSISVLASSWDDVASRLQAALESLTEAQLLEAAEGFPVSDRTARGAAMFMAWHESYHLGQIGMLRTEMGKPSVQARRHAALSEGG